MPELPEVETTRRGIAPVVCGQRITRLRTGTRRLRYPVDPAALNHLTGSTLNDISRRGKYLIFDCDNQGVLVHLGMSGSLRLVTNDVPDRPHDHWEICFENGVYLRYHDPRRFGALLYWRGDPLEHSLLAGLGVEPLSEAFTADFLYRATRGRRVAIKTFLMDSRQIVGVGNIYANESLFLAGVRPTRTAGTLTRAQASRVIEAIRVVLASAIAQGGTTLRDFVNGHGEPGYFRQSLKVYERTGLPCVRCGHTLEKCVQGQRGTWFCRHCQK